MRLRRDKPVLTHVHAAFVSRLPGFDAGDPASSRGQGGRNDLSLPTIAFSGTPNQTLPTKMQGGEFRASLAA